MGRVGVIQSLYLGCFRKDDKGKRNDFKDRIVCAVDKRAEAKLQMQKMKKEERRKECHVVPECNGLRLCGKWEVWAGRHL